MFGCRRAPGRCQHARLGGWLCRRHWLSTYVCTGPRTQARRAAPTGEPGQTTWAGAQPECGLAPSSQAEPLCWGDGRAGPSFLGCIPGPGAHGVVLRPSTDPGRGSTCKAEMGSCEWGSRLEPGSWWGERCWGAVMCLVGALGWGLVGPSSTARPGMGAAGVQIHRPAHCHALSPWRPARRGGPGVSPAIWGRPPSAASGQTSGSDQRRNQSTCWPRPRCCLRAPAPRLAPPPRGGRPATPQASWGQAGGGIRVPGAGQSRA